MAQAQQQLDFPEELINKARVFFKSAEDKAYGLNYDYAIELYLDGLSFWPDALEEGHIKLREIAQRRCEAGGKKSGFGDGSKYKKGSNKNPKDAMLKAEYLLSKEPGNTDHMMDMAKGAAAGEYKQTAKWIADILFDLNLKSAKPSLAIYHFLREHYKSIDQFTSALKACQVGLQQKPNDKALLAALNDLSVQAAMEKGRYDTEGDFRDSIKDRGEQAKLQDQESIIKSDEVKEDIIEQARNEYEAAPEVPGKINKLIDALCAAEKPELEEEAIGILEKAYAQSQQFRFKQKCGDIRIKQMGRKLRHIKGQLKESPDDSSLKARFQEAAKELQKIEIDHYKLCFDNYPTDMGIKFEYGKRLFQAQNYEEAIPIFQQSRTDPRFRVRSNNYIGQCFFYTEWYPEAVASFTEAFEALENKEDETAKELRYNLGRAQEADGNAEQALEQYRRVAQIDYNYRDVKKRVDALRKKKNETNEN